MNVPKSNREVGFAKSFDNKFGIFPFGRTPPRLPFLLCVLLSSDTFPLLVV